MAKIAYSASIFAANSALLPLQNGDFRSVISFELTGSNQDLHIFSKFGGNVKNDLKIFFAWKTKYFSIYLCIMLSHISH